MAAAVPFALKAAPYAASAVTSLFGKKAAKPNSTQQQGMQLSQQAAQNVMGAGNQVSGYTKPLIEGGMGDASAASKYYQNILGSGSAARTALGPETATALNYYSGAANKLGRGLRGADRTNAMAELDRQKVGQIAGMLPTARANAAGQLGSLGLNRIAGGLNAGQTGVNAATNAGYLATGIFNQGTQVGQQQRDAGKNWGGFVFDLAKSFPWGKPGAKAPSGHGGIFDVND